MGRDCASRASRQDRTQGAAGSGELADDPAHGVRDAQQNGLGGVHRGVDELVGEGLTREAVAKRLGMGVRSVYRIISAAKA